MAQKSRLRLSFDTLEARVVPTVSSVYRSASNSAILNVVCSNNSSADNVSITNSGTNIKIDDVTRSNDNYLFSSSSISQIKVWTYGGNDKVYSYVNKSLTVYCGTGNDYVYGGTGKNYLYGEDGNDELLGDATVDYLYGGYGNDKLYGYGGVDYLYGQNDNDYLSGGSSDDYMNGGSGFDRYRDVFDVNKWVIGYQASDVQQEASPICTIAAAIASAAEHTDLNSDIYYLGNNKYSVRLVKNGSFSYQTVSFDGTFNDNDLRPSEWRNSTGAKTGQLNGEFWTTLYARAYLQLNGVNWADTNTANWGTAWQSHTKALYAMTGWKTSYEYLNSNESTSTALWIRNHLLNNDALTVGGTGHAYMIKDAYTSGGKWFIRIYNPWGYDAVHKTTLNYSSDGKSDGYLTVSWTEFWQNFDYVYLADS